ncbi:tumor necrosis factor receptor superfamily member 5 [Rhinoderma darwinii]|uniref:tumor necrosis factor receptor superfamily member 5 n=1 Tax=Rhinoderma darwinii TaxID=43563 RepID=UPI003F66BED5
MYPWIILLILCSCYCQRSEFCVDVKEYEKYSRCCSLCRPGQRLVRECTEHNETVCFACSPGQYQAEYHRETSCLLHQECNKQLGFEKISEGTPTTNVNCRCQVGKHCSSESCETCVLNKVCGPGEGVVKKATSLSDTQCSPCNEKTFSAIESEMEPCKNWSKCGDVAIIIQPGTSTADVVCSPSTESNTWVYILVIMVVFVVLVLAAIIFIRKSRRKDRKKNRQNPPEANNQLQLINPIEGNLPEEDQDDQDITMQGLPVAQEQGKDWHISQEEV